MKRIDLRKIQEYYRDDLFGDSDYEEDEGGYYMLEDENKFFGVEDGGEEDKKSRDYIVGIPEDYPAVTALRFALKMEDEMLEKMIKARVSYRKKYGLLENADDDMKSEDEILSYLRIMVKLGDIECVHKAIENLVASGNLRGYFFTRVLVEDLTYTYHNSELVAKLCLNMIPTFNVEIGADEDLTEYYEVYGEDTSLEEMNKCRSEANAEFLGFLGASFDDMPDQEIADRYTEIIQKKLDELNIA